MAISLFPAHIREYTAEDIKEIEEMVKYQMEYTYIDEEMYEEKLSERLALQREIESMGFELKKNYILIREEGYKGLKEQCRKIKPEYTKESKKELL